MDCGLWTVDGRGRQANFHATPSACSCSCYRNPVLARRVGAEPSVVGAWAMWAMWAWWACPGHHRTMQMPNWAWPEKLDARWHPSSRIAPSQTLVSVAVHVLYSRPPLLTYLLGTYLPTYCTHWTSTSYFWLEYYLQRAHSKGYSCHGPSPPEALHTTHDAAWAMADEHSCRLRYPCGRRWGVVLAARF